MPKLGRPQAKSETTSVRVAMQAMAELARDPELDPELRLKAAVLVLRGEPSSAEAA